MKPAKLFIVAVALSLASGCARRPGPHVLQPVAARAKGTDIVTVYAATSRKREKPGVNRFTNDRARQTNYAEFTISFPPGRKAGQIAWPKQQPDPRTSVAVLADRTLDENSFVRRVLGPATRGKRNVAVFVHGYNHNFQEALFRHAQIAVDGKYSGAPVLFSWPSQAAISGYVADKDSANFSRDNLTSLLTSLAQKRRVGDIVVYAHSMGGWLTVEALRQLRLMGRNDVLRRLHVVLASPDIDVDVFQAQMRVIGPLRTPMTVLTSSDDKALLLSRRIGGAHDRVGSLDVKDPRVLQIAKEANIAIVDISNLKASDDLNHDRYATLATIYAGQRRDGNTGPRRDLLHAGAFVFSGVGTTVASPFKLVGEALEQ